MSKSIHASKQKEIIEREFAALGFSLIYWNSKPNANGPDAIVKKGNKVLLVEVKTVSKGKRHSAVKPVTRTTDDLIAIILNDEYVLIEPMKDHLKACSKSGSRGIGILF